MWRLLVLLFSFCFSVFSSFLLRVCELRLEVKLLRNVVLLNYVEVRGQQKRFFMSSSCFILKNREVLPGSIYLETTRSSHFSLKSSFYTFPFRLQFVVCVKLFSFFWSWYCEHFLILLGHILWKHLRWLRVFHYIASLVNYCLIAGHLCCFLPFGSYK